MTTFEEALNIVLSNIAGIGTERIPFQKTLNRVLAEDILSDIDIPPFNKAAMDGYACRKEDLMNQLEIIEEIPAGSVPAKKITANQCSRIMTGAMVPEGADFILMKEHASITENGKILATNPSRNDNICMKGEDVKTGDIVLSKGELILPQHIAILASVGKTEPRVYIMPAVAVLSTGNELVEPKQKPGSPQIRNSNAYQLMAQIQLLGINPEYLGIVKDDELDLQRIVSSAINQFDVIIISGGVSVGDYDFVPVVLQKLGVHILFHGLTAKPGKHLLFGKKDNHYIFGMPGNPVSSFVQFELLTKPLLNKLAGKDTRAEIKKMPLEQNFSRKKSATLDFVPIHITEHNTVFPVDYHGSAHIHSYTKADAIMEIPIGVLEIEKGEFVNVRRI